MWDPKPSNKHPVIALNMYRITKDRMHQIGQSWLKHGIFALEHDACNLGCRPTNQGNRLGPGCSDPYGAAMNRGPDLGSRSEVNPVTGHFDGPTANDHRQHAHRHQFEHSLQISPSDLLDPEAEFVIEGHYVTADDAIAGNALNNVSHRKLRLVTDFRGQPIFVEAGDTVRLRPAITAWPGATFVDIDSVEAKIDGKELKARFTVAAKVTRTASGVYRYEYAIYNLNSARGVHSFAVPAGRAMIAAIGMSTVLSHGEPWSNDKWDAKVENGRVTWSTKTYAEDRNANAIRWGTTYNFWFEASTAPVEGEVFLGKFLPGEGPDRIAGKVLAPSQ
jgi:hypothetical protein